MLALEALLKEAEFLPPETEHRRARSAQCNPKISVAAECCLQAVYWLFTSRRGAKFGYDQGSTCTYTIDLAQLSWAQTASDLLNGHT